MTQFGVLNLSNNKMFTDGLPAINAPNMRDLDISDNDFGGTVMTTLPVLAPSARFTTRAQNKEGFFCPYPQIDADKSMLWDRTNCDTDLTYISSVSLLSTCSTCHCNYFFFVNHAGSDETL